MFLVGPKLVLKASEARVLSYGTAIAVAVLWTVTRHWALHNIFAIAFCIQVMLSLLFDATAFETMCLTLSDPHAFSHYAAV